MNSQNQLPTRVQFEEGFTGRTMLGALFIGLVMVPGSMYLGLVAGSSLGGAAEWVTIILFVELAKRSFTTLKKQEIYLLYYVAVALMMSEMGSAAFGPLWNQYLVQSDAAKDFGLSHQIPHWISPPPGSEALATRTLLHPDWVPYLCLFIGGIIMSRVSWFSMAYLLFRVTSDVERLEYPLAPIAAGGATALAESSSGEETWRWRTFSIGAVIGMVFGFIYVGIPTFSGAITGQPLFLLPIPWVDMTHATENFLPATAIGFTCNIGTIIVGMVLPYWVVIGTVAGVLITFIANPILYHTGFLPSWHPGMDTIQIMFVNNVDFWLSFGMGTTFAVAVAGIYSIAKALRKKGWGKQEKPLEPVEGRGDFPMVYAIGAYVLVTLAYIIVCRILVPDFPLVFFIFFGFIFTPINSYINARMVGLTGQFIGIPFVQEGTYILSGYKGTAIWFAPIPVHNYGGHAQKFKEMELTRTKFTSLLKAELLMLPIVIVCAITFWSFLWKLGPIPSPSYPYAQKMWRLQALNQCLWISGTASAGSWVAPQSGGADVYERGEWLVDDDTINRLSDLDIRAFLSPQKGAELIGTNNGLYLHRNMELSQISAPGDDIRDLAVRPDGKVWIAWAGGAAVMDGTAITETHAWNGSQDLDTGLRRVLVDAEGDAFFMAGNNFYQIENDAFIQVEEDAQLESETISDLAFDRSGVLWICTDEGIQTWDGRQLSVPAGAPDGRVFDMTIDERDTRYFLLPDQLAIFDGAWSVMPFPEDVSVFPDGVLDTDGEEIWIGSSAGIFRHSKEGWEHVSDKENAPSGPIVAMDVSIDQRWLLKAIKPGIVGAGFGFGLFGIIALTVLGLPVMLIYGFIRSLGSIPHVVLPEIIGALVGRYYFLKKFGKDNWPMYTPVLAAGFACGMGLIGMIAIAVVLATKSVISTPF